MRTSEQLNELAGALSKAQGEIEAAHRDSNNPFFKSKYADLASVWDACREPLSKNGLSVIQMPRSDGAKVTMETRLLHSSGQWIEGELDATAKDEGPQSIGSTVTYLRRYMLQSVTGVAPDDDDAEAATARGNGHAPARQPVKQPPKKADDPFEQSKATKTDAERTPEEIYNSASKAIKAATVPRLGAIKGGIDQYAAEGKLDKEQVRMLYTLMEKREEELAVTA